MPESAGVGWEGFGRPGSSRYERVRGLYEKYTVTRNDGSSALGEKHHGCYYFVLDTDHDPHALPALEAYRASCEAEYPKLAEDLRILIMSMKLR